MTFHECSHYEEFIEAGNTNTKENKKIPPTIQKLPLLTLNDAHLPVILNIHMF